MTVPKGAEVVSVPPRCRQIVAGSPGWTQPAKPGAHQYMCRAGNHIDRGAAQIFRFTMRIDEVIAGATGQIEVTNACAKCEVDQANNRAPIIVNGSGGSGGGGLAITGPPVAAVVGAALMLLVAGAGGVLVARRRRTRFLA